MAIIEQKNTIAGTAGPFSYNGTPTNGTSEVWSLTIGGTPSGGTFQLAYEGIPLAPTTWSATNATLLADLQADLDAIAAIGTGGFVAGAGTLSSGIGTATLTAGGNLAKLALTGSFSVLANNLTGTSPTVAVTKTTAGVTATQRGAAKGATLVDTSSGGSGKQFSNTGTPLQPTWSVTGIQS